jgi:amino acid transporter
MAGKATANDDEPPPPTWILWFLGAAAVVFVVLLAVAGWYLWTTHHPVCNTNFPARRGDYPSWVFVFAAIGAFVLGSVTSQVGIQKQHRKQKELGEGRWRSPKAVVAVNLGVAGFLFLVTILMGIEAWTLGHGVWPITYYVRCSNDAGASITLVGVATYAFVIGRWMWVFKD